VTFGPDWFSVENLRKRASVIPDVEDRAWTAMGEVLHNMLGGGDPEPGPPWTHTIVPPEPIGWDEDGNPVYPEPGDVPAFTITEGGDPYHAEILPDTPTRCWFPEDEPL
jgi:hypothetical protein